MENLKSKEIEQIILQLVDRFYSIYSDLVVITGKNYVENILYDMLDDITHPNKYKE